MVLRRRRMVLTAAIILFSCGLTGWAMDELLEFGKSAHFVAGITIGIVIMTWREQRKSHYYYE